MPFFVIHGLQERELESFFLKPIKKAIISATVSIKELALTHKDISFSFVSDPSIPMGNSDVLIITELLIKKPERTFEVRQRLANAIARSFKSVSGNENRRVEVKADECDPEKVAICCLEP